LVSVLLLAYVSPTTTGIDMTGGLNVSNFT
jgi:hypothetical protein